MEILATLSVESISSPATSYSHTQYFGLADHSNSTCQAVLTTATAKMPTSYTHEYGCKPCCAHDFKHVYVQPLE